MFDFDLFLTILYIIRVIISLLKAGAKIGHLVQDYFKKIIFSIIPLIYFARRFT